MKKLPKTLDSASTQPLQKPTPAIKDALEEVETDQITGPFKSTRELIDDLLS
ncbi:MAG: hypothetical protein K2H47_04775 [Muribaculaceae bacterium]|nr:hypothetical protein [Muribaculaceae bacterium]